MKRLLKIAAAVAVLGLAAVAVGGAVTFAQDPDGPVGTFLGKVADKLGVSEDELKDAIEEARDETIDEAVAEGRLTEEQAARLKERTADGRFLLPGRQAFKGRLALNVMGAAAQVLDMTNEELMQELKDGNSLAQVAEGQRISVDEFTEALLSEVQSQLDDLVAEDKLTQEQADRIFQSIESNIDRIVNAQPGSDGFGGPRHRRGGPGGPWHRQGGPGGPQRGTPSNGAPEGTRFSGVTA